MKIPNLMLITDGSLRANPMALHKIFLACQNKLPAIQLREKQMEARELWKLATALKEIASSHGTFLSIHDRIDIALAIRADGVHLSERSVSPEIPKKFHSSLIVGVSVHSVEMGLRAEREGADYVLFGPIFQTPSKERFGLPQGLGNLEEITRSLSIPVLAVGGITSLEVRNCIEAGAHGVAAITAFMQADDSKTTVNRFLRELHTNER